MQVIQVSREHQKKGFHSSHFEDENENGVVVGWVNVG
jgi:hypothetical protein